MQDQARQLLEKYCNNSDIDAFNHFYRSSSGKLWQLFISRGCEKAEAYDLLSETFMRFIQVVCNDLRSPLALLYRIGINVHIDQYRRNKTSPVITDNQFIEQLAGNVPEFTEQRDYVEHLMKNLPQYEQNLLFMRYWTGLTHKEIAKVMDVPEGTVRRQCAAIINKLKDRWREEDSDA